MKTILVIVVSFFLLNSCKNDDSPTPVPPVVIKPDTLSSGWKKIVIDTTNFYKDIFFNSNSVGYLIGNKVYKTIDGGLTWTTISNKSGFGNISITPNENLFLSRTTEDSIYRSTNGGISFTSLGVLGAINGSDIFFTNNSDGYYVTLGGLCITTDGAANWKRLNTVGMSFATGYSASYFLNNKTGWIVNPTGLYKCDDTLVTWSRATFMGALPTIQFYSVFATPNKTVYAITLARELYKSIDGGISFSQIKIFPFSSNTFCDIHFVDNNTGYVCVGNRIYKTIDAGINWTVVVALGEATLIELHFTDATHGWACGSKGTVLVF